MCSILDSGAVTYICISGPLNEPKLMYARGHGVLLSVICGQFSVSFTEPICKLNENNVCPLVFKHCYEAFAIKGPTLQTGNMSKIMVLLIHTILCDHN